MEKVLGLCETSLGLSLAQEVSQVSAGSRWRCLSPFLTLWPLETKMLPEVTGAFAKVASQLSVPMQHRHFS